MTKTDAQKNKIAECSVRNRLEIATSRFIHRLKNMATGDDFLKVDLYDAWLDTSDESILDENFEPLVDERVNKIRT